MKHALRGAMMGGGKKGPTARDYVQDGLIAMWDGIENAGWGVCDNSAQYWTDLVRPSFTERFNLSASDIWMNDGLSTKSSHIIGGGGNSYYFYDYGNPATPEDWQFEIALSIGEVKQAGGVIINWRRSTTGPLTISTAWTYLRFTGGSNGIYGSDNASYSIADRLGDSFAATFSMKYGDKNLYCDGSLARTDFTKQLGDSLAHPFEIGNGGQDMVIKCIRIYNRSLTSAEISANYAVDKARFNI